MAGFTFPFGLPRWLIRIALPPSLVILFTVRTIARARVSSVTFPLASCGTLRSTRTKAFLPLKSNESIVIMAAKVEVRNANALRITR